MHSLRLLSAAVKPRISYFVKYYCNIIHLFYSGKKVENVDYVGFNVLHLL